MADLAASAWPLGGEEAELVSAVRGGSEEAFDRLLTRYHASVYNLLLRMVGDRGYAEDTAQEVFLKVYRGLGKFQAQSSLKTWIFRIAVHEGCNYRRWWKRRLWRETSLETPMNHNGDRLRPQSFTLGDALLDDRRSPFEEASSQEIRRAVDQALSELPEAFRTVVVLRDLEGLSYEEISEVLEVSLGTVKSRLARGREALKSRLAGWLEREPAAVGGKR